MDMLSVLNSNFFLKAVNLLKKNKILGTEKMKKMTPLTVIILTIITLLYSCDTTDPQIEKNITIQEYDVAVMEAYIHLSFENKRERNLQLFRNSKYIYSFFCSGKDTVIIDTSLTKKSNYIYEVKEYQNSKYICGSNSLSLTTLEPSSHNFIWEEHTFGDYQSFLYDVAVIEEPGGGYQIWAVGEVYLKDEDGNYDSQPYGLVKWDGNEWNILKTKYRQYNQTVLYPGKTITILSFGENNNYLCSSSSLVQWQDGNLNEKAYFLKNLPFSGQVSCMWGTDENNIYLGSGRDGSLYHYYGEGWNKLDVGTINGGITDVFGYKSSIDNKWKVFSTVTFVAKPSDHKILRINEDNSISQFPWLEEERISCVWTKNGVPIYSAGNGVHVWKGKKWEKISGLPTKFAGHVSGTAINDIFVVGDFNMVIHFNGETWKVIEDNNYGWYQTVKVKEDLVVMVGTKNAKGIVKIGKR